jgi:hypothetical protein
MEAGGLLAARLLNSKPQKLRNAVPNCSPAPPCLHQLGQTGLPSPLPLPSLPPPPKRFFSEHGFSAPQSLPPQTVSPPFPPPYPKQRFFSKYEFSAPHLLCCSDCEPLLMREVLALADAGDMERRGGGGGWGRGRWWGWEWGWGEEGGVEGLRERGIPVGARGRTLPVAVAATAPLRGRTPTKPPYAPGPPLPQAPLPSSCRSVSDRSSARGPAPAGRPPPAGGSRCGSPTPTPPAFRSCGPRCRSACMEAGSRRSSCSCARRRRVRRRRAPGGARGGEAAMHVHARAHVLAWGDARAQTSARALCKP